MSDEKHCETCICGRRAPVQSSRDERGRVVKGEGTIAWSEHVQAWSAYAAEYGRGQSAERLAERGGFCWLELLHFLKREPATWEARR